MWSLPFGCERRKKNGSIKLRIMSANMILIEGFLTLLFLMHKYWYIFLLCVSCNEAWMKYLHMWLKSKQKNKISYSFCVVSKVPCSCLICRSAVSLPQNPLSLVMQLTSSSSSQSLHIKKKITFSGLFGLGGEKCMLNKSIKI